MKRSTIKYLKSVLLSALVVFSASSLISCSDDDDAMVSETGMMVTYSLDELGDSGVSGTATLAELDNGSVKVTLDLDGTPAGGMHPAHIHDNTAADGGGIAISLEVVDGSTGMSETIITAKDDESPITYEQLTSYDGYINVHLSADDLGTVVAQGDIGQNELTGETKTYTLGESAVPSISGTITFSERVNNEALATISLMGTPEGGSHPAHIHFNTAAEGGGIAVSFTPVDGTTGMSKTNIAMLDDETVITYAGLLEFDGYVNVHLSSDELGTIVAQGDIGQNELTGMSEAYTLNAVDVENITGTTVFYKRLNGETLVVTTLAGIDFAGDHPSHIHTGSVANAPAGILITLTSVNGMGISKTNVTANNAGDALDYAAMIAIDGYLNVHLSSDDLGTLVAQGNVGAN